ncbi:MAG: hypothetical protein AB1505_36035 [Candidatus Latescibacterota bacterium]
MTGFIDDDPAKQRASIHGVTVLGTRGDLPRLIDEHQVQELLITPVAFPSDDLRELEAACWQKRVVVRRVAGLSHMVGGDIGLENLENVDISDLLGRPEVELDPARATAYLQERVVRVTGAGGSIGSSWRTTPRSPCATTPSAPARWRRPPSGPARSASC